MTICERCGYQSRAEYPYCPACGQRINETLEKVIVYNGKLYTILQIHQQAYEQLINMYVDDIPSLNSVLVEAGTNEVRQSLVFEFDQSFSQGFHKVQIEDSARPYNQILPAMNTEFVELDKPFLNAEPYVLIGDGLLSFSLSNLNGAVEDIFHVYCTINNGFPFEIGRAGNGNHQIKISEWESFGIRFDISDLASTQVDFYFRLWDLTDLIPLQQRSITFVDRYRLRGIQYLVPGLPDQEIRVQDQYGETPRLQSNLPITIYTYQNPLYGRTWQRDKRYFKVEESYRDILSLPPHVMERVRHFDVSLDYDKAALDLKWHRLDQVIFGDTLLHVIEAKQIGTHNVVLNFTIADISAPGGLAKISVSFKIVVTDQRMEAMGLGLDFGTSRTMACLFDANRLRHLPMALDLHNKGTNPEDKLVASIIPRDRCNYYDDQAGLIYPYICNPILTGNVILQSYVKRELPAIIRGDSNTAEQLRQIFESMFETIARRIIEYCLQDEDTGHKIPLITDISLGCPTVFNDAVIAVYRDFLKNVCSYSLLQPGPDFEITVWDEVWAAFGHINNRSNLPAGNYLIWDMGGGTTDVVLVKKADTGTLNIIGFNSDYFGGKDINEAIKSIVMELNPANEMTFTEMEVDSFKAFMADNPGDSYREVPNKLINDKLLDYCKDRVNKIGCGLIDSMQRFGESVDELTIIPVGGGSLLRFIGDGETHLSIGELIKRELEKMIPNTRISINHVTDKSIGPKECTSLGLAALANAQAFTGKINRLPGFFGRSRYNIVHSDIYFNTRLVMAIGDDVYGNDLLWEENTRMFMVFGGSNLSEQDNPPIVYNTSSAWEGFRRLLRDGNL